MYKSKPFREEAVARWKVGAELGRHFLSTVLNIAHARIVFAKLRLLLMFGFVFSPGGG